MDYGNNDPDFVDDCLGKNSGLNLEDMQLTDFPEMMAVDGKGNGQGQ